MTVYDKSIRLVNLNKVLKYLFLFVVITLQTNLAAQNRDSLKLALKNSKHDSTRCNILTQLIETEEDADVWPKYNAQLLKIAEAGLISNQSGLLHITFLKHLAYGFNNKGVLANEFGSIDSALFYYQKAQQIQEKIGDKNGVAASLNNIGFIYNHYGDVQKALEYYHRSLKICEEINYKMGISVALNNLGLIYVALKEIPKGVEYYQKSLKICEEIGDREGIATSCNNIGAAYDCSDDIVKATEYYKKSLMTYKLMNDKRGIATALNNIGMVHQTKKELNEALKYYEQALVIEQESDDRNSLAYTASNIANVKFEQGLMNEALKYALLSLETGKALGYPDNINKPANILKLIYEKQGNHKLAYEMYELEIKMRDSINNEKIQKAAVKKQIQYSYGKIEAITKKEHEKELEKQKAISDEKQRKQTIVIWSVVLGLILVIGFALYVYKTLSLTRRQKLVIEKKSREVEEKQREILDSIHYAKRIQRAFIPSEKYIGKNLSRLQGKA